MAAHPAFDVPPSTPARALRPPAGLFVAAVIGVLAYFAYGRGFPNTDAMWTLVWGQDIWHGRHLSYNMGPTPHPLTNLIGLLLAPLGRNGEAGLQIVGYLSVGALIYGTGRSGARVFSAWWVGVAAALLLATRDTLLFYGALAYLDVLFAALVIAAFAMAVEDRRTAPMVVLAIAGLVRPEGWVIAGCLWLYRAREPGALRRALLVVAAPVIWVLCDLIATGRPLYSFTFTRDATPATGEPSGVHDAFIEGWRVLGQGARPLLCVSAIVGLALTWRERRTRFLVGALVVTFVATMLPVAAGTPLNERYLLPTVSLLCVAAAGSLSPLAAIGPRRLTFALCALLILGGLAVQVRRFHGRRDLVVSLSAKRHDARSVLTAGVPCTPLVVPNARLAGFASVWAQIAPSEIVDGARSVPRRGSYVWGNASAMAGIVTLPGRAGAAGQEPSARIVRTTGAWRLRAACGRDPATG